jgi:CRISPR/Cas system-associated protein endoribonuclease Cas2
MKNVYRIHQYSIYWKLSEGYGAPKRISTSRHPPSHSILALLEFNAKQYNHKWF